MLPVSVFNLGSEWEKRIQAPEGRCVFSVFLEVSVMTEGHDSP